MAPDETTRPRAKSGGALFLVFIAINVVVFLCVKLAESHADLSPDALIKWGANYAPLTLTGESWRLVTSLFLHGGWMHLLTNMYMLVILGSTLERRIGAVRFGCVYLLSGLGGGLLSAMWQGHHETRRLSGIVFDRLVFDTGIHPVVSVGASGALMGMAGAMAADAMRRGAEGGADTLPVKVIAQVIGYNLIAGFVFPGVDNAAHLGGLLSGAWVGFLLCRGTKSGAASSAWRIPAVVTAVGLASIIFGAQHGGSAQLSAMKSEWLLENRPAPGDAGE